MTSPKDYIRRTTNHGNSCWLADVPPSLTGKSRMRRFFSTSEDAETWVGSFLTDGRAYGQEMARWIHQISPRERVEIMLAVDRIRRAGFSLSQAADLVEKKDHRPTAIPAGELANRFLAEKENKGCRARHMRNLRERIGKFLLGRTELPASELTAHDVRTYLNRNGWAPATRRGVLIDLKAYFTFAVKERLLIQNPCDGIEAPILDEKPPTILTVAQIRTLLETCETVDPGLLAFVALCLFGGLRREECLRLELAEIGQDFVEIKGHKAKTRQRRLVPVTPQLKVWIEAGTSAGATFPPQSFNRRFEALRRSAGLWESWDQNALRHSFVSYHYAMFENAGLTAAIAGHSEAVLFRHYRALVKKADAEVFFGLLPDPALLARGITVRAERVENRNRQRADAARESWKRRKKATGNIVAQGCPDEGNQLANSCPAERPTSPSFSTSPASKR